MHGGLETESSVSQRSSRRGGAPEYNNRVGGLSSEDLNREKNGRGRRPAAVSFELYIFKKH
jgi:hypothetical protein